jgi:hypothetical protein
MSESVEGIIELEGMHTEPIIEILLFLYTNHVEVSSQNCVGVLIYSMIFQLYDLASNCRNIVVQNFNAKNVIAVLEVAELHGDQILKRLCINFVKKNFEAVCGSIEYDNLDEKVKKEIFLAVQKYQEQQAKKRHKKK